jgi:hypothetical protein
VDFVLDGEVAVEVKAAAIAQEKHTAGLRALREEGGIGRFILVCREDRPRMLDGVEVLPWREFLELLWADRILYRE